MFETLFGKKSTGNISPSQARERLAANKNALLLDVRTPEEYSEVHIPHSISLPLNQLKSGISKVASEKNTEIIVYCLSGMRAASACKELAAMGYTNVSNMGGIQGWKYGTEKGR
jgi:phage shock protein E